MADSPLVAALAELQNPATDSRADVRTEKGNFSYTYASLPAILNLVRPVLKKHGLAVLQSVLSEDGRVGVKTFLMGEGGPVFESGILYLPAGNTPQTAGSAITYARRYSLCALLGIAADEDDDAGKVSAALGEVAADEAGPGGSPSPPRVGAVTTETSPGPAPINYPIDAAGCSHKYPSGRWLKWDVLNRCPKCGTPRVSAVEGTTADLGPA